MVQIIWTDAALQDLNDIGDYISKDSFRYAGITIQKLFESADILEQHPRSGVITPEFNDDSIRNLVRGDYKIVNEFRIHIITVHNCARLLSNTKAFKKGRK